jgi:hypothetical protein
MSWDALRAEFELWKGAGFVVSFWWRDDDAVKETPALRRLLALRESLGVPLALAIIPEKAERIPLALEVDVLQHGWAHRNHGTDPKMELGGRPTAEIAAELQNGWEKLGKLFSPLPVMVPPWNRIAPEVREMLPRLGYRGLSTFKRRQKGPLTEINTHLDIVDWSGTRGFVGEERALEDVIGHLRARRLGEADRDEPTGLLTHHLAHDEACWRFVGEFVAFTRAQPGARWGAARDIFGV